MIKIYKYEDVDKNTLFIRDNIPANVEGIVSEIISNVINNGDKALKEYAEKFDKCILSSLEVTKEEIDEAFAAVEPEFIRVLEMAAQNIRHFHEKQVRNSFIINDKKGVVMGQKVLPIE